MIWRIRRPVDQNGPTWSSGWCFFRVAGFVRIRVPSRESHRILTNPAINKHARFDVYEVYSPLLCSRTAPSCGVSRRFVRLTRGRQARRSFLLACWPRVKQDKTLCPIRSHLSETPHSRSRMSTFGAARPTARRLAVIIIPDRRLEQRGCECWTGQTMMLLNSKAR